ncbi:MAG: hypothetical protein RR921_02430 [Mucinivorans sp.]
MYAEKDSTGRIGLYDMTEQEAELLQMAALTKAELTDRAELAAVYRRIAMAIDRALPNPAPKSQITQNSY